MEEAPPAETLREGIRRATLSLSFVPVRAQHICIACAHPSGHSILVSRLMGDMPSSSAADGRHTRDVADICVLWPCGSQLFIENRYIRCS
jgi:hypothetical protein